MSRGFVPVRGRIFSWRENNEHTARNAPEDHTVGSIGPSFDDGSPAQIRVDGKLRAIEQQVLNAADTKRLAYSVMTDGQKHQFEEKWEIDFSFGIKDLCRFRANVFTQRGAVAPCSVSSLLKSKDFKSLNLPPVVEQLCDKPRGLILVTGPTGSGKSTTLAAMIDKINMRTP